MTAGVECKSLPLAGQSSIRPHKHTKAYISRTYTTCDASFIPADTPFLFSMMVGQPNSWTRLRRTLPHETFNESFMRGVVCVRVFLLALQKGLLVRAPGLLHY